MNIRLLASTLTLSISGWWASLPGLGLKTSNIWEAFPTYSFFWNLCEARLRSKPRGSCRDCQIRPFRTIFGIFLVASSQALAYYPQLYLWVFFMLPSLLNYNVCFLKFLKELKKKGGTGDCDCFNLRALSHPRTSSITTLIHFSCAYSPFYDRETCLLHPNPTWLFPLSPYPSTL